MNRNITFQKKMWIRKHFFYLIICKYEENVWMDVPLPHPPKIYHVFLFKMWKVFFFAYNACLLPRFRNSLLLFKLTRQMQNSINLNFFLILIEYNLQYFNWSQLKLTKMTFYLDNRLEIIVCIYNRVNGTNYIYIEIKFQKANEHQKNSNIPYSSTMASSIYH